MLAAAIAGCEQITGQEKHELAGTYEFTAAFDTFSFETSPYMVPGCVQGFLYCTLRRPMTEATLSGVVLLSGPAGPIGDAVAHTSGRFCEASDWRVPSGCAVLGPVTDREYRFGKVTLLPGSEGDPDSVMIDLGRDAPIDQSMATLHLWGHRSGDDIVGTIYWSLTINRSPPSHRGTFIARRIR